MLISRPQDVGRKLALTHSVPRATWSSLADPKQPPQRPVPLSTRPYLFIYLEGFAYRSVFMYIYKV